MLLAQSRILRRFNLSNQPQLNRFSHLLSHSNSTLKPSLSSYKSISRMSSDDNSSSSSNSISSISRLASLTRQLLPSRPLITPSTSTNQSESQSAITSTESEVQEVVGHLTIGPHVRIPISNPKQDSLNRLPANRLLLDLDDVAVLENLEWLGKKWSLEEDVFLLSPPSPYARRLALTFCAMLRLPYEYVSLHRDVGEAELLQTRSLLAGGSLRYEDGPVVRAMKEGRILIIEGTERAERNVMPLLNNILENREQNLADGTQLIPQHRLAAARAEESNLNQGHSRFVGVHPNFRVIAIGVPTPPYKGHALDPPFRSRFQARWVEGTLNPSIPSSSSSEVQQPEPSSITPITEDVVSSEHSNLSRELSTRFFEFSSLLRLHGHAAQGGEVLPPTSRLPNIPGTALTLLSDISRNFPPILPLSERAEEGENLASSLQGRAEKKLKEQEEAGPKAFQGEGFNPSNIPSTDPYLRPPPQDGALQVANHVREKVSKTEALWYERIKRTPIASLVAPSTRALLGSAYPMMHLLERERGKLLSELLSALGLDKGIGINDREELLLSLPEGKEMEKDSKAKGSGLMGYRILNIERLSDNEAKVTFENTENGKQVSMKSPCGKLPFANLPPLSSASEVDTISDQEGVEFDKDGSTPILITPRLMSMLSSMLQLHCLGRDICLLPSSLATGSGPNSSASTSSSSIAQSSASSSTSTCISLLASLLGYPLESVHLYKDISGQELIARRATSPDGSTTWESSPLLKGLLDLNGKMVHLNGIDTLGPTLGSLSRLTQDRETELWGGRRGTLSINHSTNEISEGPQNPNDYPPFALLPISPSFRLIATSVSNVSQNSSGGIKADWLTEEASTLFGFIAPSPMSEEEEMRVVKLHALASASRTLSKTQSQGGYKPQFSDEEWSCLWEFARKYRTLGGDSSSNLQKSRRLGTRSLIRIASRMALSPTGSSNGSGGSDLHGLLSRALLTEFLPLTTKELIRDLLSQCGIQKPGAEGAFTYKSPAFIADPEKIGNELVFVDRNAMGTSQGDTSLSEIRIPIFNVEKNDPDGKDLIPTMSSFYNNPTQSLLMREIALDLEKLDQHVLLMGNQGTGKNKVIDRILELLNRPREYMQLHRDSTVAQILQLVQLEKGQLRYIDSPLVRGIKTGRVVVVDEADKCSAAVTAVFKSLAERGELTLPDGRRVRPPGSMGADDDVLVHPSFKLVLLSNRPGFPFLGNSFLEVIGEGFSCFSVSNPDLHSEIRLLSQAAPQVPEEMIKKLVLAVGDLRDAFDSQQVSYPYSLRELLHIVRHMNQFPEEDLTSVLLNVLSFDLHKPESMNFVVEILKKRGLPIKGLDLGSVREVAQEGSTKAKEGLKVAYDPKKEGKSTDLDKPKEGKIDKDGKPHVGGNTWRGGTGGRDTAGMGGRGGFERLWDGNKVHQISDELKKDVPDHIKKQAREMAREALAKKLAEEGMTSHEGATYQAYKREMLPQTQHLLNVLNDLQANAKERSWLTRQQEGELDERRLTDGLAGERSIFKRRQEAPPELGAPQTKPKRLRFVVDVSASMYAMQFDGRLDRQIKTVVMIMEAMSKTDPSKYSWSIYGHSGDEDFIPFVKDEAPPTSDGKRWKVLKDMYAHTQFCGSGDNTLRGIEKAVRDVTKVEGDDYFVIALSDAQMSRYGITSAMLTKSLNTSEKVKSAVIFIDRGQEAQHIARQMAGKAHIARETKDLPQVLSSILTAMVS